MTEVPLTTLARIFKDVAFKKTNTKITENTLEMSGEYIRLFVREAVLRSNEQRMIESEHINQVDGVDNVVDDFEEDEDVDPDNLPEPSTQEQTAYNNDVPLDNYTLDSRHLANIAGVLVLDF